MLPIRGSVGVNVQVNHTMILVEIRWKIYFNPHSFYSPGRRKFSVYKFGPSSKSLAKFLMEPCQGQLSSVKIE
jgi:hypothetical protein